MEIQPTDDSPYAVTTYGFTTDDSPFMSFGTTNGQAANPEINGPPSSDAASIDLKVSPGSPVDVEFDGSCQVHHVASCFYVVMFVACLVFLFLGGIACMLMYYTFHVNDATIEIVACVYVVLVMGGCALGLVKYRPL